MSSLVDSAQLRDVCRVGEGRRAPLSSRDLIAVIEARLAQLGLSERQACLNAGLKADAIRTIRRGHPPLLSKLHSLAGALGLPTVSLTKAAADVRLDEPSSAFTALASRTHPFQKGAPSSGRDRGPGAAMLLLSEYAPITRLVSETIAASSHATVPPVLFSTHLLHSELKGLPQDFRALKIEGRSMEPLLLVGDEVLIDIRRQQPVEAGPFALDEGLGAVVRWIEYIPGSKPAKYRVGALGALQQEVNADSARIIGRVVWLARRL